MAQHHASIEWVSQGDGFQRLQYSREHVWRFDGGAVVAASSSPAVVPLPWSNAAAVDPEEAFVAAVASCHMLWWLSLAARQRWDVVRYRDEAVGVVEKDANGRVWVSRVTLQPTIEYGEKAPSPDEEERLHHQAHDQCFIANSIRSEVVIQSRRQVRSEE
jgi:organic hydroperoxide reductase OsmC/OhrA